MIVMGISAMAQSISVKSFQALPMDMTASSVAGKRIDQNNEVAALIKIVTTQTGFTFEAGALGVVDSKQETGEVWVWVPRDSRKLTIKHPQLGVLRDYRYPIEIQSERTYEMVLTTAKIETIVKEEVRDQFLVFQLDPPDAMLEVDDQIWEVGPDGTAMKFVSFGTYTYRVQAPNYHPDAGKVTVDDPDNTKVVPVSLVPNFGYVEVSGAGNLQGASVFVDNALIGKAPCKSGPLKSGKHVLRIAKDLYDTYTETVTVNDNETMTLTPTLKGNFAEVTFTVDADAEIWVNNERKGVRSWTGPLGSGTYKVECRQESHETSQITQEITADMGDRNITLSAPRPIYGSLSVESMPLMARIYIDGKEMGVTPKSIPEILIGRHELRLSKEGYADYTETVDITKGERRQVKATMSSGQEIQFTCNVPNAQLEIDGQRVDAATGTYMLSYGSHSLRATAQDYHEYTGTLEVTEATRSHSIAMKKVKQAPEGAIDGKFSVGENKQVYFSRGNLQYQASTNTWRFAEHQYDYVGFENSKIAQDYDGWIDLFGWGTSGWNCGNAYYQPWNSISEKNNTNNSSLSMVSSNDNKDILYGPSGNYDLTGACANADWGVYNPISNGGNEAGLWRLLTIDEWKYVFEKRKTPAGMRFAKAEVQGVKGVILLPDDWDNSIFSLDKVNGAMAKFNCNIISASQWIILEQGGAVFFPASGYRNGTSVLEFNSEGAYWASTSQSNQRGRFMGFFRTYLLFSNGWYRSWGLAVRLVCPVD